MGKLDFDNLMKVVAVTQTSNGTAIVDHDIDFDLPRGYIAKIHYVEFSVLISNSTPDGFAGFNMALVNDPDDNQTVSIPTDTQSHDVVCEFSGRLRANSTPGDVAYEPLFATRAYNFDEMNVDVVAARNMKFNSTQGGTNPVSGHQIRVYYTLEKVTSKDMLELLDIL